MTGCKGKHSTKKPRSWTLSNWTGNECEALAADNVIGWLRRFGQPRPFTPSALPRMLADVHVECPSLRRWVAHPQHRPTTVVATGGAGAAAGPAEELIGLDIFAWSPEAGAGHVLELRGLNERLSWNVSVNLGGRRQVATEIVPALDINSADSLAKLLEGLNSMIICSGVPSRVRGAISHFSARLKPFCPRTPLLTIPMELVIHLLEPHRLDTMSRCSGVSSSSS